MFNNTTQVATHLEIIISPLLTSGIIGTTLSITIFSHLLHTNYRRNCFAVLGASVFFASSSLCTLIFISYYEDTVLLWISRTFLFAGILFILTSLYPLYRLIEIEGYARETEQLPDLDFEPSPEYVNLMSP